MAIQSGLVQAFLLDRQGSGQSLNAEQISEWQSHQGLLWVHVDYTDEEAVRWLTEEASLDPVVVEALTVTDTRPRCTPFGQNLLLVLRGVNLNPGAEPDDMVSIRLWVEQNRIISTRKRQLASIQDMVSAIKQQQAPMNSGEFVVDLADHLTWRMSDTIENYDETLANLEDRILSNDHSDIKTELSSLRRQIITLHRYLAPQRDALARLQTEKQYWLDEGQRLRLREVTDRMIRYLEDIDAMRERAIVIQEELQSQLSEKGNQRVYLLSIITAVFLPLGLVTGLLGINVGGMPGADNPDAFLYVSVGLFITGIILTLLLRRKNWL
ncbi:zinc transporter [Oceanospirillum multiglobuliferum]|uniref:Zinc transporter ZntB n=1 Tax=Oceanospirillum multiglobuliferum TaxID=64969 RepID=A0A1T4NCI6_9GAMM|nr:zinc transporter ZntB [Oceanospirillum multiglobuliferum]OPX55916.1 zinc transporter ZntB [Oceanospirillum multiglobuliferum]SJZ77011.1 zinc transporter [Oceanospirillum multiglobuliferum]